MRRHLSGSWTAHLVEPHAARLVTLSFMEPKEAEAAALRIAKDQAEGRQRQTSATKEAVKDDSSALIEELDVLRSELAQVSDRDRLVIGPFGGPLERGRGRESSLMTSAACPQARRDLEGAQSRAAAFIQAERESDVDPVGTARWSRNEAEGEEDATTQGQQKGVGFLSPFATKLLLVSNVALALTLLLVLRNAAKASKATKTRLL